MYDGLEDGEIRSTTMDDSGEVKCEVTGSGEEAMGSLRLRMPCGLRARVRDAEDSSGGADCVFARTGDEAEIIAAVDRDCTEAVESASPLAKGATQLHSLGDKPQSMTIEDKEVRIGNKAEKRAARVGDEIKAGKLRAVAAGLKLDLFYMPEGGTPPGTRLCGFTVGQGGIVDFPPPGPGFEIQIIGVITKGSSLVKIEGDSQ